MVVCCAMCFDVRVDCLLYCLIGCFSVLLGLDCFDWFYCCKFNSVDLHVV